MDPRRRTPRPEHLGGALWQATLRHPASPPRRVRPPATRRATADTVAEGKADSRYRLLPRLMAGAAGLAGPAASQISLTLRCKGYSMIGSQPVPASRRR